MWETPAKWVPTPDDGAKASKLARQCMLVNIWRQAPHIDLALWRKIVIWALQTQTCISSDRHDI